MEVLIKEYEDSMLNQVRGLIIAEGFPCGPDLPEYGFVAVFDGAILGYVGGHHCYGKTAYIDMLIVHPIARGAKIGLTLLKRMILYANELGIKQLIANVDQDNTEAIKLYERLGLSMRPVFRLEQTIDELFALPWLLEHVSALSDTHSSEPNAIGSSDLFPGHD